MSELSTQSMYERYPFKKRKLLDLKVKGSSVLYQRYFKAFADKRYISNYKTEALAEVPLDIQSLEKVCNKCMPQGGPFPWLDRPNALSFIAERHKSGEILQKDVDLAQKWIQDGYVILENVFDSKVLDDVWKTYERACFEGKVPVELFQQASGDLYLGRCLNAHKWVPALKQLYRHPVLMKMASFFLGVEALPFQTITGFAGSEQLPHSDSIHMSSYPLGYLTACWIAFEDIAYESGPLVYYPGSHKLPYLFSHHLPETNDRRYKHTRWYGDHYEPAIAKLIQEHDLKPQYFTAKKGDVLFWHANLIHGGSARLNRHLSRRALVAHYFGKGAFCYGDRMESIIDLTGA